MMNEFTKGIFNVIASTSIGRAGVYTIGHILISMTTVKILTDASWFEAGVVALVEPILNGIWYYILDKSWTRLNKIG